MKFDVVWAWTMLAIATVWGTLTLFFFGKAIARFFS